MNEIQNILIGFQLGKDTCQICYYDRRSQEPLLIPTKVGSTMYEFPTSLCKMQNKEQWHFGLEAEYFGAQPGAVPVDDLYGLWCHTESRMIDRHLMEPSEVLAVFMEESLKMLGVQNPVGHIRGIMVTCQELDRTLVANVRAAFERMGFSREQYYIQNYRESFYYYTLYQKPELWMRKVAFFQFEGNQISYEELEVDKRTLPALVTVSQPKNYTISDLPEKKDEDFHKVIVECMGTGNFSTTIITGEGFDRQWASKSITLLSKNHRHVFHGNNLFVKGACYGAKEKTEEKNLKNYLYMGQDLIRTNVGMEMLVQGMKVYYPLIAAGVNWYEAEKDCEFILDDRDYLSFLVGSMKGGEKTSYIMRLPDLPDRPNRTTRLRLQVQCSSPNQCTIQATDMGFGDLFPATRKTWTETLSI